jgi:hypothetical protein
MFSFSNNVIVKGSRNASVMKKWGRPVELRTRSTHATIPPRQTPRAEDLGNRGIEGRRRWHIHAGNIRGNHREVRPAARRAMSTRWKKAGTTNVPEAVATA